MKKCFYKSLQKYSRNTMNRLNFELAAFCFDDESETGFHWSARTSHRFFVQLGPSWLNDRLQRVLIGVITSLNIPLQNKPANKVHGISIRLEGAHKSLSRNPPESVRLRLIDIQRNKDRCVSLSIVLYELFFVLESFCEPRKNFFSETCSNKLLCWISSPHQWIPNEICSRLMQQQPKP